MLLTLPRGCMGQVGFGRRNIPLDVLLDAFEAVFVDTQWQRKNAETTPVFSNLSRKLPLFSAI
jgi:hypothetical protein